MIQNGCNHQIAARGADALLMDSLEDIGIGGIKMQQIALARHAPTPGPIGTEPPEATRAASD